MVRNYAPEEQPLNYASSTKESVPCSDIQDLSHRNLRHAGISIASTSQPEAFLLTTVTAGPVWPTSDQLDIAHSYGIIRQDGLFTRLIRADQLPSAIRKELGIPERQGPEGLILVPQPRRSIMVQHPIPLIPAPVGRYLFLHQLRLTNLACQTPALTYIQESYRRIVKWTS